MLIYIHIFISFVWTAVSLVLWVSKYSWKLYFQRLMMSLDILKYRLV
jgi:hypothetical protein